MLVDAQILITIERSVIFAFLIISWLFFQISKIGYLKFLCSFIAKCFLYNGPCEFFIALYLICWVFEIPLSASMSNHCQLNIYWNCSCFCFALLLALRRCGACTSESQCYLHLEVSRKGVKMNVVLNVSCEGQSSIPKAISLY